MVYENKINFEKSFEVFEKSGDMKYLYFKRTLNMMVGMLYLVR